MSSSLCCIVEWHIVNISSFCDTKNEGFYSKMFVINSLHNSSWFLKCYRNRAGGPVFALRRSIDVPEWKNIHVKFDFSLLDEKGSSIYKGKPKFCYFKVNEESGYLSFIEQSKILHQAENYFPQDVCRIRFQIFTLEEEPVSQVKFFYLRTYLPVKNYFFDWRIDISYAQKAAKTLRIVSPFGKGEIFTFTIKHVSVHDVRIDFSGDSNLSKFSWQFKIYPRETKIDYLKISEDLPALTHKGFYKTLIPLDTICSTKYLCGKYLVLTCELSIIFHEEMHIPTTNVSSKLQSISCDETNKNGIELIQKPKNHSHSSLKNDIVRMYQEGLMTDFTVKVKDSEFPVHSLVLASRSSVFRTMLKTNMKEKQDKVLKLDDMDENVIRQFLDYLYTDDPGELTVDLAFKFYSLGHLYEIEGLKEDSARFLKLNINISNIGDIIVLSEQHEDEGLMSAALQFIFHNEKEVLLCKDYKDFARRNAQLSVDIFFKLTEMRLK